MKVIKRDGREVEFDKSKIRESVLRAYAEVDGEDGHFEHMTKAIKIKNDINEYFIEE